jgi:hypothetical protein
MQLNSITSSEEFSFQVVEEEDNDDLPDTPEPVPWQTDSQPVGTGAAHNILHFFTDIEFPDATKDNEKVQKVCKLCM